MASENPDASSRYLTYKEVADELGISRAGVADKVNAGQLRDVDLSTTPGGRRTPRIPRSELDAYCARVEEEGRRRAEWIQSYRRV